MLKKYTKNEYHSMRGLIVPPWEWSSETKSKCFSNSRLISSFTTNVTTDILKYKINISEKSSLLKQLSARDWTLFIDVNCPSGVSLPTSRACNMKPWNSEAFSSACRVTES